MCCTSAGLTRMRDRLFEFPTAVKLDPAVEEWFDVHPGDVGAIARVAGRKMIIKAVTPQLRTTNMESTIRFYTEKLGFTVEFNYQEFYAGLRVGEQTIHLKLVNEPDPSFAYVDDGGHLHLYLETNGVAEFAAHLKATGVPFVKEVHETPWQTREFVIHDDQGHTLYFGEPL